MSLCHSASGKPYVLLLNVWVWVPSRFHLCAGVSHRCVGSQGHQSYIFWLKKLHEQEIETKIEIKMCSPTPLSLCQLDLCLYWSFKWGKGNTLLKLKQTGCLSCNLSEETTTTKKCVALWFYSHCHMALSLWSGKNFSLISGKLFVN